LLHEAPCSRNGQIDRQTKRPWEAHFAAQGQALLTRNGQTDRQTDKQTYRQTDRQLEEGARLGVHADEGGVGDVGVHVQLVAVQPRVIKLAEQTEAVDEVPVGPRARLGLDARHEDHARAHARLDLVARVAVER
jgi:hypothetical protein